MSDDEVRLKVGQKVVCSDDEVRTVIGTIIGLYGVSPKKVDWVGVKVSEDFLDVWAFWHDASHIDLVDENGTALDYRSERDDCRCYMVDNVKVLGEA